MDRGRDVLLEKPIEGPPLLLVVRGGHLLSTRAALDPRWHSLGRHLGADAHRHQRIALLVHVHRHLDDDTSALDELPAPLPARPAIGADGQGDLTVEEDALVGTSHAREQVADSLV